MSDAPARWSRRDFSAFALVLLFALLTRVPTISRTFDRDPEGCGAYYGQLARNYLRYDLTRYYLVPVQNIAVTPDAPTFYPNHPPLLPLLIAGTYKLIGWNPSGNVVPPEWATRLSTTLFTIGCSALIFIILRNRESLRAAILGGVFFAITPMALTFGSQPDVINSQLCFFVMLTVIAYIWCAEAPSATRFCVLSICLAFAAMTDWPAFFIVPAILLPPVIAFRQVAWRSWIWLGAFGVVAATLFFVLYMQGVAVTHEWDWMRAILARRALSNQSDRPGDVITFGTWLYQALYRHGLLNVSIPIAALAIVWTRHTTGRAAQFVCYLLCWALLHIAVGHQGVFVHEWWWWPLMPAVAMAAGVALDRSARSNAIATIVVAVTFALNAYTSFSRLAHPTPITENALNYSLPEFGEAIRAAAPFNEEVLLTESDETLSLWYYADRPIRRNVWGPNDIERAMNERSTELPFGYVEKFGKRPTALVIPKAYVLPEIDELLNYCRARFPSRETDKFITFDLTKSK